MAKRTEDLQDVQVIGDEKGLAFRRHFSTEGTHPFDQVEWETRDAIIPNFKEGGNAFEQRGVEFPVGWSQNATNIVAQKYFRGPLGAPERESSVRQLVSRVVDTIRGWGEKNRLLRHRDGRAGLRRRADAPARQPEGRVQLAGVVQRRRPGHAAAVQRLPAVRSARQHPRRPDPDREARRGEPGRREGPRRARCHDDRGHEGEWDEGGPSGPHQVRAPARRDRRSPRVAVAGQRRHEDSFPRRSSVPATSSSGTVRSPSAMARSISSRWPKRRSSGWLQSDGSIRRDEGQRLTHARGDHGQRGRARLGERGARPCLPDAAPERADAGLAG